MFLHPLSQHMKIYVGRAILWDTSRAVSTLPPYKGQVVLIILCMYHLYSIPGMVLLINYMCILVSLVKLITFTLAILITKLMCKCWKRGTVCMLIKLNWDLFKLI